MKKFIILFSSAALLLTGCAKEALTDKNIGDGVQTVTFNVGLAASSTKAVKDGDGAGAKVNHWVMEVLDEDGDRFNYQEDDGSEGETTHSFTVSLVKSQKYNVLFWADTKNNYVTDSLTNVKIYETTYAANRDERDAFCAVKTDFLSSQASNENITLTRPFAQLNVIFTDLNKLYETMNEDGEYVKFKPNTFVAKAKVPTSFNVLTQTAGAPSATALEITADGNYMDNYTTHEDKATLFMDYFFASKGEKDLVDIEFSFLSNGNEISHTFTSVPFQRNYRTNILGDLMSNNAQWNITVDATWNKQSGEDINVYYTEVTKGKDVENAIAAKNNDPSKYGKSLSVSVGEGAGTGTVNDDVIIPDGTLKDGTPQIILDFKTLAKDAEIIIRDEKHERTASEATTEAKEYEGDITVVVPEGTKAEQVKILTGKSTVTVRGEYGTVIASCAPQTIIVDANTTVETLKVMKGNAEIFGTVKSIVNETAAEDENKETVYVYLCQGSSWTNVETEKSAKLVPLYPVAKVSDKFYFSIPDAIAAVNDGETVSMISNVTLTEKLLVNNGKEFTFDLGGKTLAGRVNVSGAKITLRNGTLNADNFKQALNAYGTTDPAYKDNIFTYIKVEKDVILKGDYGMCFLSNINEVYQPICYGVKVDFYGKSICASPSFVSGNIGYDNYKANIGDVPVNVPAGINSPSKAMALYGPVFNVYGTLGSSGGSQENSPQGISLSGMIRVNIFDGATITGDEAVGMKSGILKVFGGTLASVGAKKDPVQAVSSGTEASGAAISITSFYTSDIYEDRASIEVSVSGGTVQSTCNSALLLTHSYSAGSPVALKQNVNIKLDGGNFIGGSNVPVVFMDNAADGDAFAMPSAFISGGIFNAEPKADYIAKGHEVIDEGSTWKVQATEYFQLAGAIADAPVGGKVSIYGENFTKADDGYCYLDATNKTGRLVYLTVVNPGNPTTNASVKVNTAPASAISMQSLFLGSERRLDNPGSYLKNGDMLVLPDETLYLDFTSTIYDVYGDVTLIGSPKGKSIIRPFQTNSKSYRFMRLYNRYKKNVTDNIIYHFNFKNVTFDGMTQNAGANLFVVTCYNIRINMDNCIVRNFNGSVFSIWANDTFDDNVSYPTKADNVGVEVNLTNTTCTDNGRLVHYDCSPYQMRDLDNGFDRYAFIHVNYDSSCTISNKDTYSFNANTAKGQGNCLLNGVDVWPATD